MKKNDFLQMMWQDNETEQEPKKTLYADVIECMALALSQSPDSFEVPDGKTIKGAYELIEKRAKEKKTNCVGPFEAAEIIAADYGTTYERPSKQLTGQPKPKVNLDDFM